MPTVVLVTAAFEAVARSSAAARGLTDLPIVVFPADLDAWPADAVTAAFDERFGDVLAGLRRDRA